MRQGILVASYMEVSGLNYQLESLLRSRGRLESRSHGRAALQRLKVLLKPLKRTKYHKIYHQYQDHERSLSPIKLSPIRMWQQADTFARVCPKFSLTRLAKKATMTK